MANLSLERLIFDPADAANSPNLGAYLRAGSDGDLISSTLISGKEGLDVNLINASVVVTATDLDIRDLTHVSDSVQIGDGTDFLAVNADGSINVNILSDGNDGIFAEDSAHVSGDNGAHVLSVRSDVQASLVSASGDYASLQQESQGRLKVYSSPNGAIAQSKVTAGLTEVELPATNLAGRVQMIVQNISDKSVFVGPTGVTVSGATQGMEITKGGTLLLETGDAHEWFVISSAAAKDVLVTELA